ncbi:COX15/CtaA family protein [Photobacterium japonica]|uniref:COX15/CtaA family protein n=1 Tax=Photobacterium japonica TaxID=2910235 RepID=UPI003D15112C
MHRDRFRYLVLLTFVLALGVIALGAYTRLTEAGLGCPDWPGCYGFAGVPQTAVQQAEAAARFPDAPLEHHKAWNEMLHRYVAGALGLLILLINILAWRRPAHPLPPRPKLLPALLLVVVIFQAALGMWTVTLSLMPVVVMGHLLGGFTTAALLFALCLSVFSSANQVHVSSAAGYVPTTRQVGKGLSLLAGFGLVTVIGQIALGGWTAANYAALVCTQLPICEVDWQQQFDPSAFSLIQPVHDTYQYGVLDFAQRVSIHVSHRLGAMITSVILLLLAWRAWRVPALRRATAGMLLLLSVQVALGITNVVASLPLTIAVAHNVTGVLLLLSVVALNVQIYRQRQGARGWRPARA